MRYIIGIDLGTTNSAVAYVDREKPPFAIQQFSIPQLVAPGRVETATTLPSFCYLGEREEWPAGVLKLPWKPETLTFVGEFAKLQGARVPTRLVQSAKSWLCHVGANRRDKILPVEAADISKRLSPVEASANYLNHLKEAWNSSIAKGNPLLELEAQDIILTVPASFDEVARSLTLEAARLAGLNHLTLVEEPQAAFYSWISQHEQQSQHHLKDGDSILVCDVGGGTTDFSLIEVKQKDGGLAFERMAVGDHLLLGGDNMDAALAHYVEAIFQKEGYPALPASRWNQLISEVRAAKEFLLKDSIPSDASCPVTIQGSGSSVVGGSMSYTIRKEEIESVLIQGFFGRYALAEALELRHTSGIRTMGLPYENEPSITKQLAHFLEQAHYLEKGVDYILFNGGAVKPRVFQNAIQECLKSWFPSKNLELLTTASLDLAVSRGAAYYGKVRHGMGVAIRGGLPRAYYLEVETTDSSGPIKKAMTLLPRGTDEGASFELGKTFLAAPNAPVAFRLFASHVRLGDRQGDIIDIDPEEMQPLPPIHTILRFGKGKAMEGSGEKIPVHIGLKLTEVGTLDIWLKALKSDHRWALEFQLRGAEGQECDLSETAARKDQTFGGEILAPAKELIEGLYSGRNQMKPSVLMERLEQQFDMPRNDWPSSLLRGLSDSLFRCSEKKHVSPEHEARWWNLAGFLLRPGFGYPLDDYRMKEMWKVILSQLKARKSQECQIQQWICFRRIAGGLNKGQQTQVASEMISTLFSSRGKIEVKGKGDLYSYSEKIRALASLERLEIPLKLKLGEAILQRLELQQAIAADYWALGRIGARHLVYGSVGQVIPNDLCIQWLERLLKLENPDQEQLWFVYEQLARKTDHRELNIPEALEKEILSRIQDERIVNLIHNATPLTKSEEERVFGDHLPAGLTLEVGHG